jgi:uncharacterized membrane protein YhaH (DUF805 family)
VAGAVTDFLATARGWTAGRLSSEGYGRRKEMQAVGAFLLPACLFPLLAVAPADILIFVAFVVAAVVAIYNFCLDVRRAHDLGVSGWWVALGYVAVSAAGAALFARSWNVATLALGALFSVWVASTLLGLPFRWVSGRAGRNAYGAQPAPEPPILGASWQRRMLELSFEPTRTGFVFYRDARSPGVPVSSEEREQYLSAAPLSLSAVSKPFMERPPIRPRRKFVPVAWRRSRVIPEILVLGWLGGGWAMLNYAQGVQEAALRWPLVVVGLFLIALSVATMIAKMLPLAADSSASGTGG